MKKRIILTVVFMLMIAMSQQIISYAFFNINRNSKIENKDYATEEPELHVGVFGASFLMGFTRSGFVISNTGDSPVLDINWTFSIKSISNDDINISFSDEIESIAIDEGFMFATPNAEGFGVNVISISANSSNAGEATEKKYGFQIGRIIFCSSYILAWH